MWTSVVLSLLLLNSCLAQDHIGDDSHQDWEGEPLIFMTMGDWGVDTNPQRRVAQAMANYADDNQVDFFMTLGDNFYDGVDSPEHEWFDTRWRDIYMVHDSLEYMRWYITVGNHDYIPRDTGIEWNQVYRHDIDEQWYFPNLWYCLHFLDTAAGDVDIFMIDTEAIIWWDNDIQAQQAWLEEELAASTAQWKVMAGHHPAYTIGWHAPGSAFLRNTLVPLMEEYDVDMYLIAHDHNLQHLVERELEGATDHILIGTGGRSLYNETPGMRQFLEENYGVFVEYWGFTFGFGIIKFDEDGMHVEMYNDDNDLEYTYTRTH